MKNIKGVTLTKFDEMKDLICGSKYLVTDDSFCETIAMTYQVPYFTAHSHAEYLKYCRQFVSKYGRGKPGVFRNVVMLLTKRENKNHVVLKNKMKPSDQILSVLAVPVTATGSSAERIR